MPWIVDPENPRPTMDEVYNARERLRGVAVRTPLLRLAEGDRTTDLAGQPSRHKGRPLLRSRTIWLKPEVLQPTGSFKIRGIYNAVAAIGDEARAAGVSIVSSGNAAQALAWSARKFGIPARAIMPASAPRTKIESFESLGGQVERRDPARVWDMLLDRSYRNEPDAFIHPTADRNVVAGYGAIALEILEDMPDIEAIYVPVGGGGLIAGIANVVAQLAPHVRVVGVQPAGCTPIILGVTAGKPVITTCDTFCDGVAGTFMDPDTWPLLRDLSTGSRQALPLEWATVDDDDTAAMIRHLALRNKLVAEGSGALAVAAAAKADGNRKSVAIVSGGSVDAEKLAEFVTRDT